MATTAIAVAAVHVLGSGDREVTLLMFSVVNLIGVLAGLGAFAALFILTDRPRRR